MDTAIIGMCCLLGVWLRARRHRESAQRRLIDAEIITIALTAARFFDSNFRASRRMQRTFHLKETAWVCIRK